MRSPCFDCEFSDEMILMNGFVRIDAKRLADCFILLLGFYSGSLSSSVFLLRCKCPNGVRALIEGMHDAKL